ncbi:CHC2 zinc finger domain-containing protein [Planctomycetota bacterium]
MSRLDYVAIRARVSILQVLDLIDYQPTQRQSEQWRGPCPFSHAHRAESFQQRSSKRNSNRCFSVNVRKNVFRCFCCNRAGNSLDLWRHLTGKQLFQATNDLCEKLKLDDTGSNLQLRKHH